MNGILLWQAVVTFHSCIISTLHNFWLFTLCLNAILQWLCEELWLLCWEGIWPIIVINRACSSKVVLFTHVFITTGWYGLVLRCSTKAMCKWLNHQSMALRSGRKLRRKCLLERSKFIWKLFLHNLGTITAASLSLFTSSILQFAPQHAATKMYLLHRLKAIVSSDYDYLK